MASERIKALEVVEHATNKVVSTIKINPPRVNVERTMMGLLRNMNTDDYFVREIRVTDKEER